MNRNCDLQIEKMGAREFLAAASSILNAFMDAAQKRPVVLEAAKRGHYTLSGKIRGNLVRTAALIDQAIDNLQSFEMLINDMFEAVKNGEEMTAEESGVYECLVDAVINGSKNFPDTYEALGSTVFGAGADDKKGDGDKLSSKEVDNIAREMADKLGLGAAKLTKHDDLGDDVSDAVRDLVKSLRASGAEVHVRSVDLGGR